MDEHVLVGLSLLASGAISCIFAVLVVMRRRSFLSGAERATGTVTAHQSRRSSSSNGHASTTIAPTISFRTPDGSEHSFTTSSSTSHPPSIGASVEVAWRPGEPQRARLVHPPLEWLIPVIMVGTGAPMALVGVVVMFVPLSGFVE